MTPGSVNVLQIARFCFEHVKVEKTQSVATDELRDPRDVCDRPSSLSPVLRPHTLQLHLARSFSVQLSFPLPIIIKAQEKANGERDADKRQRECRQDGVGHALEQECGEQESEPDQEADRTERYASFRHPC